MARLATLLLLITSLAAVNAHAAQWQIVTTATYMKDPSHPESFGSTAASLPFTATILVDDSAGDTRFIPANTVLFSDGRFFTHDATLLSPESIVDATFTLGNATWTENDLETQNAGAPSFDTDVIISSPLEEGNPSIFFSVRNSSFGVAFLGGVFACTGPGDLACTIITEGQAADSSNTNGFLTNSSTSISAVPLPAAGWFFLSAIVALLSRKRLTKI